MHQFANQVFHVLTVRSIFVQHIRQRFCCFLGVSYENDILCEMCLTQQNYYLFMLKEVIHAVSDSAKLLLVHAGRGRTCCLLSRKWPEQADLDPFLHEKSLQDNGASHTDIACPEYQVPHRWSAWVPFQFVASEIQDSGSHSQFSVQMESLSYLQGLHKPKLDEIAKYLQLMASWQEPPVAIAKIDHLG